jgi:ribosomal protein L14E/L6E/L27E
MTEYISGGEALKLAAPFKGVKSDVLAFTANVDTSFEINDPRNGGTLFKFVLTRIIAVPRTAIKHTNLENWEELKEFLKHTHTENRTLDYHANQLFRTKQSKVESVSEWIQRVQQLGSKFREAALQECEQDKRAGILTLVDKLRNICFVPVLYSNRIHTIVRSRNHSSFDDIAETELEEEREIFSKNERYKSSNTNSGGPKCNNCNKLGPVASRCYLKDKKGTRFNQVSVRNANREKNSDITCYNCQGKQYTAKHCRKPKKRLERQGLIKERSGSNNQLGNEFRPSESSS